MSEKPNNESNNDQKMSLDERMYMFFKNPSEDMEVAAICKEKAEAGDYKAMLWLARMYRDSKGVKKDNSMALELYKKSKNHNSFSRFELLVMLSGQKREYIDVPDGLKIDKRKKERLFVYKFDRKCMDLLIHLFPFTHYNVVGLSYEDETQVGYNEYCSEYDKILVANINESSIIRDRLISEGIPAEKIITVRRYLDKDKFNGDAIVCDFSDEASERKIWVVVPNEANGLLKHSTLFKRFKGENKSECDYIVDMKNHYSMMIDDDDIGHYNPWDYYFQSVSSVDLDEAYERKGTIISRWNLPINLKRISPDLQVTISEAISKKINAELESFIGRKKVLGVIARGTDYVSLQPLDHGIALDEHELVEIVEERMSSLGFTDVYLSTEDQDVYEFFKERFGNKLFAIEQKRFKKGSILNTIFDEKILEPFGKLIQGERYLIATHLVTKCELALVCPGTGSEYVRKHTEAIVEKHIKGKWGHFGNAPLIVLSHNKNHISFGYTTNEGGFVQHVDAKGFIKMRGSKAVVFDNVDIRLNANEKYVCSFYTREPESVSIFVEMFSIDGMSKVFNLKHNDVFTVPFNVYSGNAVIRWESEYNSEIGIQIEQGTIPTEYEPSRYSWTQICIKDASGIEYAPADIDYIDFNKGVFNIKGIEHALDSEELYRYHNIICFKGGFLTYCMGNYHVIKGLETKISFGPVIDSQRIIGMPKQFCRCSQTIEMADSLMKGTQSDMERALGIYRQHATNGNINALVRLGRIYRDGKGAEKDLQKAADLMRNVVNKNTQCQYELLDILWKMGTIDSYEEMRSIVEPLSNNGDAEAMVRLSRMYRHGKGVEKNQDKAIEWLEKAIKENSKWELELVDNLLETKSQDNYTKAYDICAPMAESGDFRAAERVGCMYRDGKGVKKNLNDAIKYMRVASEGGIQQARNGLVSLLLERGNNEDFKEAFNLASDFSKYDNPGLAVHLARMYNRGLGVTRSLDEAIRYMKIASDRGHGTAKKELIDLLLKRKKDYDIELAAILSDDLENDGPNLYRKALVMRESGGNVEKVIQCMSSAAKNGNKNAKEDLFYLLQSRSEWQKPRPNFSYYSKDNYNLSKYALLKGAYDPSNPLKSLGWNTGNLAFLSAIEKLFHPDILPPDYLKDKSSKYESLIVTDLIWIRENVDFSYLENRLKDVKIPIVLMSVGLQSPKNKMDFKLHESVIRILKRVQETNVIGVRGEYTEKILNNNGIHNTQIIGCPSMYYWNDRNYKIKNEDCQIDAVGNFRTFYDNKPLTRNEIEFIRFLKKWNCPFVEQTRERLVPSLLSDDKDANELCNYVNRMSVFYYSNKEWIDAIKKFNFSIGSRFHGNVMGIRAGFKSLFLTTDSRTEEMTSFFNLPSLKIENFDSGKPMSYYYELADYSDFNKYYPKIFDEFDKFIQENGMKIMDE